MQQTGVDLFKSEFKNVELKWGGGNLTTQSLV